MQPPAPAAALKPMPPIRRQCQTASNPQSGERSRARRLLKPKLRRTARTDVINGAPSAAPNSAQNCRAKTIAIAFTAKPSSKAVKHAIIAQSPMVFKGCLLNPCPNVSPDSVIVLAGSSLLCLLTVPLPYRSCHLLFLTDFPLLSVLLRKLKSTRGECPFTNCDIGMQKMAVLDNKNMLIYNIDTFAICSSSLLFLPNKRR